MTSPLMNTYPPQPVTFVRGQGSELWDVDGKRYLDFLGGLAVTGLGHAHPAVADALAEQARTLLHVSNLFGTTVGPEVATTLDRLIDAGGGKVFFANSGGEANECAIKLARKWAGPGRYGFRMVEALPSVLRTQLLLWPYSTLGGTGESSSVGGIVSSGRGAG